MRRALVVLSAAVAVLLSGTGTALAHNSLVSSDPAEGARLSSGPGTVILTFDQPVRKGYSAVTVVGPQGKYWNDGTVRVSGNTVTAPVNQLGPAGTYTVGYRVLSNDGHPVSGNVTFVLTAPGNGTPAPPPKAAGSGPPQSGGGMPVWPWITGAGVLVVAGLVLALRLGRPSPGTRSGGTE